MPKFTKYYLAPIFTVLINGILAYFINQIPGIKADPKIILIVTVVCTVILCILTFLMTDIQPK